MSNKMLKFVNIDLQNPPKRSVGERKQDFNEIYKEFINKKAKENLEIQFLPSGTFVSQGVALLLRRNIKSNR